ncbi:MAG: AGE family epimerase/isomerase [Pirellulales bacterium]|nr:AGE family epimerase/isomerase [Pirellulales bacterium]
MIFPHDEEFAADVRRELRENILPFWRDRSVDSTYGGFIGEMSNDLRIKPDAAKGLILNSRLLWTFSAAFRYTREAADQSLAHRAYDYLANRFHDPEYGGFFWELDAEGRVLDEKKKIYGQAFAIYALAEYADVFAAPQARELAVEIFRLIETRARDANQGGYFEVFSRDWRPCNDMRLSEKDRNEKKSMNNHLHVLEAYARLLRAWPDELSARQLRGLIGLFRDRILDASQTHFHHFFDEDWTVKSDGYTFGHDIEGSWLLCEAAEALKDKTLLAEVQALTVKIARAALQEGIDTDGGLFYEGRAGRIVNRSKEWWPQAEAVVGFWNAWQITGEPTFRNAAMQCWRFIQEKIVDRKHGEWFWRIDERGVPDDALPKISAWKCPYHNGRCCLEILRRISAS